MKKTLLNSFRTLAIVIAYNFFISCGKTTVAVANQCEKAGEKMNTALQAYSADPTNKTKCQAYIDSVAELLRDCPNFYTGTAKQALVDAQKNACK